MAFEDSKLPAMREIAIRELQEVGVTVVEQPTAIDIPVEDDADGDADDVEGEAEGGPQTGVKGNLQTIDSSGARRAFYLRPAGATPFIPPWLYGLSRGCYRLDDDVRVVIIVEAPASEDQEREARDCGAGLCELSVDAGLLTEKVAPTEPAPGRTSADFDAAAADIRQQIVSGSTLHQKTVEQHFSKLAGRSGAEVSQSKKRLRAKYDRWERWRSDRIDEWERVSRRYDFDELDTFAANVERDLADADSDD